MLIAKENFKERKKKTVKALQSDGFDSSLPAQKWLQAHWHFNHSKTKVHTPLLINHLYNKDRLINHDYLSTAIFALLW
jgi:hypothetical protein